MLVRSRSAPRGRRRRCARSASLRRASRRRRRRRRSGRRASRRRAQSAIAPATVSALTLYAWPSSSTPTVAITGMSSSRRRRSTIEGSIERTSPTKPRRGSRWSTRIRPASSPESPTAYEPCRLTDATISRLTLPTSAIRTMSTVSSSVTRRPSTNSGSLPSRRMRSVICGPPPCTTTGFMPTSRMSTTSVANSSASAASSIAWPPYLMTTVWPENSRMYGSASARIVAFAPRR